MKYKVWLTLLIPLLGITLLGGNSNNSLDCTSYYTWEHIPGANKTIQFSNQSTGEYNSWEWDFGDGIISEVYHPVHMYTEYGTYYVCLTISDGINCTDTYCDTVIVEPQCEADFNFTYVPTTPVHVQFTDLSAGYPNTWLWLFGDGTTSTEPNPVHAYPVPGNYDVCLIIEHNDSLFSCTDSICKTVIIPDSLNCEADYSYEISSQDPLKVHFLDHSTGNITDWEWNFGDGTISYQQDPEHIFPGPADYLVCLKVENRDTAEHCIHFICKTITIQDSGFCTADFFAVADSNSQVMYQYTFFDQSTGNPDLWLWDFGDGHISHEQNPAHTYEVSGTYEVCLDTWNSNYPGYTGSYCMPLTTANYHQLGGHALIGDNPINNPVHTGDTGVAVIYRQTHDNSFLAIDTNKFHELGYYWFANMMEMGYRIRISLTPNSTHYQASVPSYYPGTMHWQDADELILAEDLFEISTNMMQVNGIASGPGKISGRLVAENRSGVESHRSCGQAPVMLTNQENMLLAWTATNEYGQFAFNNIALGSYQLHADIIGMWSQLITVTLSTGYPVNDSLQIVMSSEPPFNIEEAVGNINLISLYPNPAEDHIHLNLTVNEPCKMNANIYDMTGNIVEGKQFILNKEHNEISISMDACRPGLYMICLHDDRQSGVICKKFIKK